MKRDIPEKVLVASGGDGAEREVSLSSGEAVTWGLLQGGYRAEQVILRRGTDILECIEKREDTLVSHRSSRGLGREWDFPGFP